MSKKEYKNVHQENEGKNKPEEVDMSLKEIERIGLGKRNMTNESIRIAKKKKRKKKILVAIGIFLIAILVMGGIWYTQIRETETEVENSENIAVEAGQELLLGQITVINGNEMTFALVEETQATTQRGGMNRPGAKTSSDNTTSSTGELPAGELPTGELPTGEMSAESVTGEENTSDVTMAEGTEETEATTVVYTALEEERTATIPVGTEVVTKLGTVTTFSRLASGDVMKILVDNTDEEDVILKIWILE